MKKVEMTKSARDIVWVEHWISKAQPSECDYIIEALKQNDNYVCEIELPLINKTVVAKSKVEINSIINAASKAAKLIKQYMKEHKDLNIKNEYKGMGYVINGDKDGNYISVSVGTNWIRQCYRKQERVFEKSMSIIKKAVKQVDKIYETNGKLFIQVLDKSLFDSEEKFKEYLDTINSTINEKCKAELCINVLDNSKNTDNVIVMGYTNSFDEGELN